MLAHIEVLLTAGLFPQNESKDLKKNIIFFIIYDHMHCILICHFLF